MTEPANACTTTGPSGPRSEVITAICKVMGAIHKLAKESKNAYDNYSYSSVDDFLAATSKQCSEFGLVVIQDEESMEIITKTNATGKETAFLKFNFTFDVRHESGQSIQQCARSVAVPFTGAQSFGSAQSYALKQFLRSLFQISCGDQDDPDSLPSERPEDLPSTFDAKPPETQPAPVTAETKIALTEQVARMDSIFGSDPKIFWQWWSKSKGMKASSMDEGSAQKTIAWLKDHESWSKWPVKQKKTLELVLPRKKEEPEANDDTPASKDDIALVREVAAGATACFSTPAVFEIWFRKSYDCSPETMSRGTGRHFMQFLKKNPDVSTWPEDKVGTLTSAMAESVTKDEADPEPSQTPEETDESLF